MKVGPSLSSIPIQYQIHIVLTQLREDLNSECSKPDPVMSISHARIHLPVGEYPYRSHTGPNVFLTGQILAEVRAW